MEINGIAFAFFITRISKQESPVKGHLKRRKKAQAFPSFPFALVHHGCHGGSCHLTLYSWSVSTKIHPTTNHFSSPGTILGWHFTVSCLDCLLFPWYHPHSFSLFSIWQPTLSCETLNQMISLSPLFKTRQWPLISKQKKSFHWPTGPVKSAVPDAPLCTSDCISCSLPHPASLLRFEHGDLWNPFT